MLPSTRFDDRAHLADLLDHLEQHPGQLHSRLWDELCCQCAGNVVAAWAELLLASDPIEYADRPRPDAPTVAMPGTPLKVQVLRERYTRREDLWHPADQPLLCDRLALRPGHGRSADSDHLVGVVEEGATGPQRVA